MIYLFIYKESTTPPVWYLQALTNLREEDDVTDTETEAWWTWDPGFPGLPCTRQIYSPESSGEADRIRSWLPRTCRQQTGSHFHPSVISICDLILHLLGCFWYLYWIEQLQIFEKGKGGERGLHAGLRRRTQPVTLGVHTLPGELPGQPTSNSPSNTTPFLLASHIE